MSSDLRGR